VNTRPKRSAAHEPDDDCFIDDGVSGTTLLRPALERPRDQAAHGERARRGKLHARQGRFNALGQAPFGYR
jgi:hypothetical protein